MEIRAELTFANGADPFLTEGERPARSGAVVDVRWTMDQVRATEDEVSETFGENQPLRT